MTHMKKSRWIMIICIFIVSMSLSLVLCIIKSKGVLQDNYENENRVIAGLIGNAIDNDFIRPIIVAETISEDYTTKKILDVENAQEAKAIEQNAAEHLKSLRDGFGYSIIYAVSENSKAYFNSNGISKFINPGVDVQDEWYKNFVAAGKKYNLDVDTDEASHWSLSIFINNAVYDNQNRFIGVCGVGVDISELQRKIERYERIYDANIYLTNADGLIQVCTDTAKIEKESLDVENLSKYSDGECYYQVLSDGSRTITYMENFDWYLIVDKQDTLQRRVFDIVWPSGVCAFIGLVLMGIILKISLVKGEKAEE